MEKADTWDAFGEPRVFGNVQMVCHIGSPILLLTVALFFRCSLEGQGGVQPGLSTPKAWVPVLAVGKPKLDRLRNVPGTAESGPINPKALR